MTVAAVIAVIAAVLAVGSLVGTLRVARRERAAANVLETEIRRGKARFDEIVAAEVEERARELERTLALARAESLAALGEEERRIAEQRRREVADRERDAAARLSEALTVAQQN